MSTFEVETTIDAPIADVWAALADIGSISVWNPGVKDSYLTSDEKETGMGASRYCDLGGRNYLNEDVVHFVPNEALTMRIVETNMPFKTADIRFTLAELAKGKTRVVVSPLYALKFGPFGQLLDRLFVKRTYQNGMVDLLAGLKKHVER